MACLLPIEVTVHPIIALPLLHVHVITLKGFDFSGDKFDPRFRLILSALSNIIRQERKSQSINF